MPCPNFIFNLFTCTYPFVVFTKHISSVSATVFLWRTEGFPLFLAVHLQQVIPQRFCVIFWEQHWHKYMKPNKTHISGKYRSWTLPGNVLLITMVRFVYPPGALNSTRNHMRKNIYIYILILSAQGRRHRPSARSWISWRSWILWVAPGQRRSIYWDSQFSQDLARSPSSSPICHGQKPECK